MMRDPASSFFFFDICKAVHTECIQLDESEDEYTSVKLSPQSTP